MDFLKSCYIMHLISFVLSVFIQAITPQTAVYVGSGLGFKSRPFWKASLAHGLHEISRSDELERDELRRSLIRPLYMPQ